MKNTISIKGTREGLTITLGSGDLGAVLEDLAEHLKTQGAFFRGGRVALQIGDRQIDREGLSTLSELLAQHEMVLRTVMTTSPNSQKTVRAMGLRLVGEGSSQGAGGPSRMAARVARPLDGSKGVLIRHRVRSGQVVRHTGHVVVIGDVNAGAEVVAGGDIVVWGRLFGTVHAGAMGNNSAIICALDFSPTLLRVGDLVARPGEDDGPQESYPEVAYIRDDMIVVEPWDRALQGV